MAISNGTQSSRRFSILRSSREINVDVSVYEESDAGISKFVFDRGSRSRSRSMADSTFGFEILPSPIRNVRRKSGYYLKFEIPPEDKLQKEEKPLKQFEIPAGTITLSAVQTSLLHKGCVTNSPSWQAEMMFEADSTSEGFPYYDKYDTVHFKGELKRLGKSRITLALEPSGLHALNSVYVFGPSTETSLSSILWSWPWLDRQLKALELYQHKNDEPNSIESQCDYLPKLPCPLQAQMLARYLRSVKPCITDSQFQKTKRFVEEFALKHGKEFHDLIFVMSQNHDNWIQPCLPNYNNVYYWEEAPLSNLGIIAPFCHDLWPEEESSMLHRSCQIIQYVTEFWQLIRTEKLKTITDDEGNSLCMRQFQHLFNSVRVPGLPAAAPCSFFKTMYAEDTPRNIVVIHRGLICTMNVVDENFEQLSYNQIETSLKEIMLFASKSSAISVGILTAVNMATWCMVRQRLIQLSENNAANLMEIEEAIFVLSLDHKNVRGLDMLANESLFADGCNRWYDKGLSIYVHFNGLVTVNANRTLLDGSTIAHLLHYMHLRIMEDAEKWNEEKTMTDNSIELAVPHISKRRLSNAEEILLQASKLEAYAQKTSRSTRLNSLNASEARALCFEVDKGIEEEIEQCVGRFQLLSNSLVTAVCKNDVIDEQFFSHHRINKDAFAHMALHLTFYKMYFRVASIGCKVSLKKFYNTCYDILRSTTSEMADWCKSMLDSECDENQRKSSFWKAEKLHRNLLKECYNGQGCDNYINALHGLAIESIPPGNMFDDKGFEQAGWGENYDINAENLGVGCTSCPVVVPAIFNGYGVGYSVATSFIMFCVSSWDGDFRTNADLFAASLNLNVNNMLSSIMGWDCRQRPPDMTLEVK